MNHAPSEFEQIVAIEEDPALTAAKKVIDSIEARLNAPDASLDTLTAIKDGEFRTLNEQWPYHGKLVRVSGNVFLMNQDRDVTNTLSFRNETVIFDRFELAYYPTPDGSERTWSVVSQLQIPLEDEIVAGLAVAKDVLLDYDDPQLTSQHL